MSSLLEDPPLGLLLIKSALRSTDRRHLNKIEMDELFVNTIHSALEGALCAYVVKECLRALKREFGINEKHKELLAKECSNLKARVTEIDSAMKEILESVDKFQVDLNAALASNLGLENRAESAENQVALLQHQVLELQALTKGAGARARVIELEVELQETMI